MTKVKQAKKPQAGELSGNTALDAAAARGRLAQSGYTSPE